LLAAAHMLLHPTAGGVLLSRSMHVQQQLGMPAAATTAEHHLAQLPCTSAQLLQPHQQQVAPAAAAACGSPCHSTVQQRVQQQQQVL
jgi:hypothetical protein